MTDLATPLELVVAPREIRAASRPSGSTPVFAVALSLSLAVALTIPSSEIRAKGFRLGLIAKTTWTHLKT